MNRRLALARLVRLPNVFTAMADISIGLLIGRFEVPWHVWITLPLASACLYSAGMAWNDYFDRHIDRVERPQRPIPSGALTAQFAFRLAVFLATLGLLFAGMAGWNQDSWSALVLMHAFLLLTAVLAYDSWLKETLFGPWIMGGCRFLNILLGFSVLTPGLMPWSVRLYAALALGLYVTGISYIARDEVIMGHRIRLQTGAAISILGCAMLAFLGVQSPIPTGSLATYLAAFFIVAFLIRFSNMQLAPTPESMQRFVKKALLGIIVFDAILATGLGGPMGLVIVIWLIPAAFLGRWVYST